MGMWFNNVHMRKNSVYSANGLKNLLIGQMIERGYSLLPDGENGDVSVVIYEPANSGWVSVASDAFQFDSADTVRKTLEPYSDLFGTDVLGISCYDSDYLFMNFINKNDKIDAWINVGRIQGMKHLRRTNINAMKNKVRDFEKFKNVIKQEYLFAEESLIETSKFLDMSERQAFLDMDDADGMDENFITKLSFALPDGEKKELPKLKIRFFDLMPCKIGQSSQVFVNNIGGKSKGIGVLFLGNYIENDELSFENVTFESDYGSEKRKVVPISLTKIKCTDGTMGLYWQDEEFAIPTAVNKNLPIQISDELKFRRQFGVRFTVKGNPRKVLDVKVILIPLENKENGQESWYVYKNFGSKENYIRFHNERTMMLDKLKLEDYDLD